MKKRTSIIAIIIAILVLGVGYAAISNVTLTFGASGAASSATIDNSADFDVIYDVVGNMTSSPANAVSFTRTDDHTVTFSVDSGLIKRGDSVVVTIPFKNISTTLKAQMADATITNSNSEYFSVTAASLASTKLNEAGESGDSANLVITVTAIKTPVSAPETTTITGSIVAQPTNS